jgi:hypothetical protein
VVTIEMHVEGCNLFLLPNLAEVERTALSVLDDMISSSASIDDLLCRVRLSFPIPTSGYNTDLPMFGNLRTTA